MRAWKAFCDSSGHMALYDRTAFATWLREHKPFHNQDVVLIVNLWQKRTRSYDQLRYWFGVPMKILSEKTGYTKMQMHYLALAICFGVVTDSRSGRDVPVVPASRHLTPAQFSDLIEWCPPWAWEEYGLSIPLPEHVNLAALPGVDDEVVPA